MVGGEDLAAVAHRRNACCSAYGALTLAAARENRIKNVDALYRRWSSIDRWWLACSVELWRARRGRGVPGSRVGVFRVKGTDKGN